MPWTRNLAIITLIITLLLASTAYTAKALEFNYIVESDNDCKCIKIYVNTEMYKKLNEIYLKLYVKADETSELKYYSRTSKGYMIVYVKIIGPDSTVLTEYEKVLDDDLIDHILWFGDRDYRVKVNVPVVGYGTYEAQITLKITGTLVKAGEEVDKISWSRSITDKFVLEPETTIAKDEVRKTITTEITTTETVTNTITKTIVKTVTVTKESTDSQDDWLPEPVRLMLYNPYAQAMLVLGVMIVIAVYVYGKSKS
ncbi:MAG: hypothetical protein GSR84_00565 [Desulfurococcales archaeon]|nr:hypothetical protein [Desulfurococcales archaeon]